MVYDIVLHRYRDQFELKRLLFLCRTISQLTIQLDQNFSSELWCASSLVKKFSKLLFLSYEFCLTIEFYSISYLVKKFSEQFFIRIQLNQFLVKNFLDQYFRCELCWTSFLVMNFLNQFFSCELCWTTFLSYEFS